MRACLLGAKACLHHWPAACVLAHLEEKEEKETRLVRWCVRVCACMRVRERGGRVMCFCGRAARTWPYARQRQRQRVSRPLLLVSATTRTECTRRRKTS